MMNRRTTFVLCATVALLVFPLIGPSPTCAGQSITFIHEGTTSEGFVLNGQLFLEPPYDFIITALGDVGDREQQGGVFFIQHESAMIEIVGIGSYAILSPTLTFVNHNAELVGFTFAGSAPRDLFTGPTNAAFAKWTMTTSIGPISGNDGQLLQWAQEPFVETTGGQLRFFDAENIPVSFTAEVIVPGPGPIALLPLAAILCPRRRRRG